MIFQLTDTQAAVTHSSIADTLSNSLAVLSSRTALCAKFQHVIKTDSMKRRLADVYTKLFNFFRDMMIWYMKSKASRFFDSFNDNVNKKLEETAQSIQGSIDDMYSEAAIGGLAMQRAALLGMSEMRQHHDRKLDSIEASLEEVKAQLAYQQSMMPFNFGPVMVQAFLSSFEHGSSSSFGVTSSIGKTYDKRRRASTYSLFQNYQIPKSHYYDHRMDVAILRSSRH